MPRNRKQGIAKSRSEKRYRTILLPATIDNPASGSQSSESAARDNISTVNGENSSDLEYLGEASAFDFTRAIPDMMDVGACEIGTWVDAIDLNVEDERPTPPASLVSPLTHEYISDHGHVRALTEKDCISKKQKDCVWTNCIIPGSQININEFLALFINVVDRGKVNHAAKENLLRIIGLLFPSDSSFPRTMYLLKKGLEEQEMLQKWENHYTCRACGHYIGITKSSKSEEILTCPSANCASKASVKELTPYSYVTLPLEVYIKDALESGNCKSSDDYGTNTDCNSDTDDYRTWKNSVHYKRFLDSATEPFVTLGIFSDSAPTAKSSSSNIWISEVALLDMPKGKPRLHTIWNKTAKMGKTWNQPKCWKKTLMTGLILELLNLQEEGITFTRNGERKHVSVRILFYCADSPERWSVLNLTSYTGQYGCAHCEQKGKRVTYSTENNKTVQCYPLKRNGTLENLVSLREMKRTRELAVRADELAHAGIERDHAHFVGVQGTTLLSELQHFSVTEQVPVEPMHNLFEGIGKKLIEYLLCGPKWKLKRHQIRKIDARLERIRPPNSTVRLPRSLRLYKKWKGSELYYFYMYYCIPCVHGIVDENIFRMMAEFSTVVQYLFSGRITADGLIQSSDTMLKFALNFQEIFGERHMTYNLHQFSCHLAEYISHLGPPDTFWAFRFESQIAQYKKYLQGPTQEHNKELAGKILFSQAAKKMEQAYLSDVRAPEAAKAVRTICHNLAVYNQEISTEAGTAYLRGRSTTLSALASKDAGMFKYISGCLMNNPALRALTVKDVRCYDRCTVESGLELDSTDYTRRSSRMNSLYEDGKGNFYAALKFLLLQLNDERNLLFIVALPMLSAKWNYFGLDQSSDGRSTFFSSFGNHRAVICAPHPVVLKSSTAKNGVVFLNAGDLEIVSVVNCCKLE